MRRINSMPMQTKICALSALMLQAVASCVSYGLRSRRTGLREKLIRDKILSRAIKNLRFFCVNLRATLLRDEILSRAIKNAPSLRLRRTQSALFLRNLREKLICDKILSRAIQNLRLFCEISGTN